MSSHNTFEQWMEQAANLERKVENEELSEMEAFDAYTQAAAAYTEADRIQPSDPACLYNWGRVLFILGGFVDGDEDPDEKLRHVSLAIEKFEQSVKLQPNNTDALFNLAQALATRCDLLVDNDNDCATGEPLLRRAISLFDQVYKLQEAAIASGGESTGTATNTDDNNQTPPTKEALVDTVSAVAECVTSLACLQKTAQEADKLFADACSRLEHALPLSEERKADILCDWAAVLEAKANHEQQKTTECMNAKLYEPAIAKLKEAMAAGPTLADPRCDLGDLYLGIAHGKLVEATLDADDQDESTTMTEQDEVELRRQAEARIATMDGEITPYYENACAAFKEAATLEPNNAGIKQKLGDIYFARSRLPLDSAKAIEQKLLSEAESWYQTTLEVASDDPEPVIRLAQVYDVQGRTEDYERLLNQWYKLEGTVNDLYEEDDVFEMEFIERVAKWLELKS
jgi:tetratricopeptide (TPR) repeat protein